MGWIDTFRGIGRGATSRGGNGPGVADRAAWSLIDQGRAHEVRGDFAAALRCYDHAVRAAPALAAAALNRGIALTALGRLAEALAAFDAAIALEPDYAAAHYNRGDAQARLGWHEAAIESYRTALRHRPEFAEALVAMGNAFDELGRLDEAATACRQALGLRPDHAEVHANLGHVLARQGRSEEAVESFRRALARDPGLFAAHFGLAWLLRASGRNDEALIHCEHCAAARPDDAEVLIRLGDVLGALGRAPEAAESYRRALAADPRSLIARINLGNVQISLAEYDEAIESFRAALAIAPDQPEALVNLGGLLVGLFRPQDALPVLRRAVEVGPQIALARFHLATALYFASRLDEAIEEFHRALELAPESAHTLCNLGTALTDVGRNEEALDCFRRAIALHPEHLTARSNLLFVANYTAAYDDAWGLAEAARFGEIAEASAPPFVAWHNDRDPGRRLRVGVVSADLRRHPVGRFAESVIGAVAADHDAAIDFFAYYNARGEDDVTERIRRSCRGWCKAQSLSDDDLAHRIRADAVDILVDLSGHTFGNRLPVFARKPAPVQVTWLGYWATTGVKAMDYLIADRWTLPESHEQYFTERIWRLPETRLCFTAPSEDCDPGPLPATANGYVTFGSFNRIAKLGDEVVDTWARVLVATPQARLLLKSGQLGESTVRDRSVARFEQRGVDPSRIACEGVSDRGIYLAAYRRVDIALDPFPFPGGATSAEALWMGVPVLTLAGDRFIARQGVSLLMNVGLPEWVAADPDDYVARAVAYAADRERLAALRRGLRRQVLASPAFDAPRFATHLAAALRGMWQAWCEGRS